LIGRLISFLHQAFDEQKQDNAAIEDGDGQQVHDAEVEADGAVTSSSGVQPFSRAALPTALPMPMGPSTWRMETLRSIILRSNSRIRKELLTYSSSELAEGLRKGKASQLSSAAGEPDAITHFSAGWPAGERRASG
jgi:hypothetical protein